jgi:hypothetical protein
MDRAYASNGWRIAQALETIEDVGVDDGITGCAVPDNQTAFAQDTQVPAGTRAQRKRSLEPSIGALGLKPKQRRSHNCRHDEQSLADHL